MLYRIAMLIMMVAALTVGSAVAAEAGSGHEGHPAIDGRLVPIPPSRDTVVSAIWVLVIFLVMVGILYPTAWKNVLAGLKAREEKIRKDIHDAEEASRKAAATLKQYNDQLATAEAKVRQLISDGVAQAEKVAADMKLKAQTEAEENKARAVREIEIAKKAAIGEIYAQAAELSTSIAAKILGRNINAADQQDLVRGSLDQLKEVSTN